MGLLLMNYTSILSGKEGEGIGQRRVGWMEWRKSCEWKEPRHSRGRNVPERTK